jgi:hypothetical protein
MGTRTTANTNTDAIVDGGTGESPMGTNTPTATTALPPIDSILQVNGRPSLLGTFSNLPPETWPFYYGTTMGQQGGGADVAPVFLNSMQN